MSATVHAPPHSQLTPKVRDRLARPVVLLYWLLLAAGLGLYTWQAGNTLELWIGAIAGTVLGHVTALRNLRLWFVMVLVAAAVYAAVMLTPHHMASEKLCLAFVPAVVCAYASLSDRWSLAAIWFPAVIWMLSILDRTRGSTQVDGFGIVLLGVLAVGFIWFLRVRESRRVGIWTQIAPTPLAVAASSAVLKEKAGVSFMRGGWTLGVSALAFAITAWIAPHLWKLESLHRQAQQQAHNHARGMGLGLPCCPMEDVSITRSRVREYMDLGRGHDETAPLEELDCRACPRSESLAAARARFELSLDGDYVVSGGGDYGGGGAGGYGGGGGGGGGGAGGGGAGGDGNAMPSAADSYTAPAYTAPSSDYVPPTYTPPQPSYEDLHPTPAPTPVRPQPPHVAPPVPQPVPSPAPYTPPQPAPVPHPAPAPAVAATAPAAPPPAVDTAAQQPAAPAAIETRPEPRDLGGSLLHWLAVLIAFGVIFQLVSLSLRPLRRALTLRHLRSPFWAETVDQRVSNSWQLALVGLRDGGWRVRASETPTELARRVGDADLERCAVILERARYGIQIDADDLTTMAVAADTVYDAARAKVTPAARAAAQLRWPLV